MKVLIIHPNFDVYGGAERVIVNLANYLTNHHVSNTILTTTINSKVKNELLDTRIIETNNFQEMALYLRSIHSDFDILNPHNSPAHLLHFPLKKPTIWVCNEPPINWLVTGSLPKEEIVLTKKFINKVVVADEFNQKRFKDIYGMDSVIINYGVDHDFFSKGGNVRKKWGLDEKEFVLIQTGWLTFTKNQVRTVEIFGKVKEKIPNAKLLLVGTNVGTSYCDEVQKKINELKLESSVILTGELEQDEIRDLYHSANVFLAPIKSQGGWLSVFEAMSGGLPVVVSEEMTASSVLKENNVGFVAKSNEDFVSVIMDIFNDGFVRDDASWVKKNLSWDKFGERMLNEYENLYN